MIDLKSMRPRSSHSQQPQTLKECDVVESLIVPKPEKPAKQSTQIEPKKSTKLQTQQSLRKVIKASFCKYNQYKNIINKPRKMNSNELQLNFGSEHHHDCHNKSTVMELSDSF